MIENFVPIKWTEMVVHNMALSNNVAINMGAFHSSESLNWAVACVVAYERHLSDEEIVDVENSLIRIYGLPL